MRRREFVTLVGAAATWPLAALAQEAGRVYRIGVLSGLAQDDPQSRAELTALREVLARLGWIVGRNLQSEDRFAAGDERRIRDFAEEIVGRMPDVILARGTQATEGLKQQTSTVPIVFVPVSDPVASGFVTKLRAARRPRTAPFRIPACLLPGSRRTAGCSPRKPPLPSVAEHDRNAALRTTAR